MTFSTICLYLAACFAVTIIPGPTMLLALANGTARNWRIAGMGMLGAALSDLILIGAVAIGLGAVLAASELFFSIIKWVGVVYLLWLAIQLWRHKPTSLGANINNPSSSAIKAFRRSLLVALSNPKGLLFFSAFLPQFINTSEPQTIQYITLAILTATLDITIMACYASGGAQAARLLTAKGLTKLNRACASSLISLAVFLALYKKANA
ncbi:LysE family translocator [uncultured Tolumonas sp.]|uniref:LysE family translocator n=1 Tax=uncultured Tolumonas sp. TaxID=263765 RepID=UPI00292D68EB|nr:LysE family translocator [uncultured Tolumonas sp.]